MKKLLFIAVAMATLSLASCGNRTEATETTVDSVDSCDTVCDSTCLCDSIAE